MSRSPTRSQPTPSHERLDLRLVPAAAAAWATAWQVRGLPPAMSVAAALAAVLLAAGLLARPQREERPSWHRPVAAALLCAAAAAACTAAASAGRSAEPLPSLVRERATVELHGTLTDDPRRVRSAGGRDLVVVSVRAERLVVRGVAYRLRAPLVALVDAGRAGPWLGLLPGQGVAASGRLAPARPGDRVAAVLTGAGAPRLLERPGTVQRVAGHLRAGLRRAADPLPPAERGLLPGLVVGDTSRLTEDLREDFRATGLAHLTAVSGTNVAIVLGAVLLACRAVGVPLRARPVLGALALVGFVVLARPSPSVLRAAAMGAVGLLALATGERRRALPALAATVLVLVLLSPDLAAEPGFALSVLATAGLLLLAPPWQAALARRLPGWLAAAVAVPAAAQAACGPVLAALGGGVGLLSVPANLLAVPAVAPATVLGVLAALLAPLWLPAAQAAAWAAWLPTAWLVLVARTGAGLPVPAVPWPEGVRGGALLAAGTTAALVLLARPVARRAVASLAAGSLAAAAVVLLLGPRWPPPGWVAVFCDVGQGDATVLRAGPGSAVVVDVGPEARLVDRCLAGLDVRQVPVLLLTHLHADHVDGLSGALRDREVGEVHVGPLDDPPEAAREVEAAVAAAGARLVRPAAGERRSLGALDWEVLGPRRAFRGTRSDPNNASLVLRVTTGGTSLLLTGDVEPEAQRSLLRDAPHALSSEVLKVPHHGSAHQEPAFLAAVAPRLAVSSSGTGNGYGHPAPETLAVLRQGGALTLRTDLHGDVAVAVQDGQLVAVPRRR